MFVFCMFVFCVLFFVLFFFFLFFFSLCCVCSEVIADARTVMWAEQLQRRKKKMFFVFCINFFNFSPFFISLTICFSLELGSIVVSVLLILINQTLLHAEV